MGFQTVYKSLDKLPIKTTEDKVAKTAALNCWNIVTTLLAASGMNDLRTQLRHTDVSVALLNWQWSRTGGPSTYEEIAILISGNIHTFYNGCTYWKAGDSTVGPLVMAPALVSLLAFGLQVQR